AGSKVTGVACGVISMTTEVSMPGVMTTVRDCGAKVSMLKDTTDVPFGMVGRAKLPFASLTVVKPLAVMVTPGIGVPLVESTTMPIRPVTALPVKDGWLLEREPKGLAVRLRSPSEPPPPQERSAAMERTTATPA